MLTFVQEFADTDYICTLCGSEMTERLFYGYCDESMECTGADIYVVATREHIEAC